MKFTDGYWLMHPGVKAHYASQAYTVEATDDAIEVLATTRVIRHRGDTLQGPTLNVRLSSPMEDVICVSISHFTGGIPKTPTFLPLSCSAGMQSPPTVQPHAMAQRRKEGEATLTSGQLSATIGGPESWSLTFEANGKTITRSPWRGLGYLEVEGDKNYLHEQLALAPGECVYGLGERFTPFVKNGQTVDIWNRDGGTGSEQAYKSIPFYITNRGYGVFVNHPGEVSFEVASEKVSQVQFSVADEELEYFVIYGPSPKEILAKYTALTGRPALPPAWSFGLWLSTSFTTNYDEATVTSFIQGMADRDLPLHVFHFDCFWMKAFRWCDFSWDSDVFPDPNGMLARLKARGLKISVWINSYIAQASPLFKEGRDFLLKKPNGDVWQWDMWQPGMGIVDFTNPAATDWFKSKLRPLIDQGVDAFKTDFGERIPTDVAWHDGSDPQRMHNYYPYLYNRAVFEVLSEKSSQPVVFARSATAGGQQYPVHWGGDCFSSFESMAESLRGGLSLGLGGFGFWSHDIGGFEGNPPPAVYKRWIQFGLLSSHSRLHGSGTYRVPWLVDEESCDVLRKFTKLKCRLMPYLYAKAVEAKETGVPMMRAMILEFPDDPACTYLDRQYMLGDALLVAPIFEENGEVEFYLPAGTWVSLLDGRTTEGGRWLKETHDFHSLPLYVRPNHLLILGARDDVPDYNYLEGHEVFNNHFDQGATATAKVYRFDGLELASIERGPDGALSITWRSVG